MAITMEVFTDRDKAEVSFLRETAPLPDILRNLNLCTPFVGMRDGMMVAECLVRMGSDRAEVLNHAAIAPEDFREIMEYIVGYSRQQGLRYVEVGCGNADLDSFGLLQRLGFRVAEVRMDQVAEDTKAVNVINSIINRDLIVYRADLEEKQMATTGSDFSGRT